MKPLPEPPRLMLIGVDGVDLRLVRELLPREAMPNLNAFLDRGAGGPLESVFPTHSAAAWSSMMTGLTPAGHGVFDFQTRSPDGRYRHAAPDPDLTLWRRLNRLGWRTGVYNFPVSYPPMALDGWMVSGMLTPDARRSSYPLELADALLAEIPDYQIDLEWVLYEGRLPALLRDLAELNRRHARAARFLLARQPVDLFAAAFIATDRAQHAIWSRLDPLHPAYREDQAAALLPAIVDFYRGLDDALGEMIAFAGLHTTLIFLSDHGFQSAAWQFHVDGWLADHNWLAYAGSPGSRLARQARRLEGPRLRALRRKLLPDLSRRAAVLAPGGTLDWSRTLAYGPWNFHQGVRLNLRGREVSGIVEPGPPAEHLLEEIRQALLAERHPQTGAAVVRAVFRTSELYSGPYLPQMPDLVFDLLPNFAPGVHQESLYAPTGWVSGDHSLYGMLAAGGPGVRPGEIRSARLVDIAPLALKAFGASSDELDSLYGRPLPEISPEPLPASGRGAATAPQTGAAGNLTPEEEAALLEHLRNLGYL